MNLVVDTDYGRSVYRFDAESQWKLRPIAERFGLCVNEFVRQFARAELPAQVSDDCRSEKAPASFCASHNDRELRRRIRRVAATRDQTEAEFIYEALTSMLRCIEAEHLIDPNTRAFIAPAYFVRQFELERLFNNA